MRRSQQGNPDKPGVARLRLAIAAVSTLATLAACGPGEPPPPAATGSGPAANRTSTPPTTRAAATGFTPDQVCATISVADVARISGFHVIRTEASMSGPISVCSFIRDDGGHESSALFVQYDPTGRTAFEFLKNKGEAVSGFPNPAVWYTTSAELGVELGGDAVLHEYVADVRFHGNDPKTGAIQIAQIVVPALPSH
jgi:hypothetical protein